MIAKVGWEICRDFYQMVLGQQGSDIDVVVGILRGGSLPATVVSHVLDKPVYWVKAKAYKGMRKHGVKFKNLDLHVSNLKGKKVLVCDDIFDTGDTILKTMKFVKEAMGAERVTGCVMITKNTAECEKNVIAWAQTCAPTTWIVFPWEKVDGERMESEVDDVQSN